MAADNNKKKKSPHQLALELKRWCKGIAGDRVGFSKTFPDGSQIRITYLPAQKPVVIRDLPAHDLRIEPGTIHYSEFSPSQEDALARWVNPARRGKRKPAKAKSSGR